MMPQDDVAQGEVLVVRRVIPVPRARVFAAWLDPVGMTRWMCPGSVTRTTVALDPRVGGSFVIVMTHQDQPHEHRGEYLAIEPPSLLSFTWLSDSTLGRPTVVTVEFHERDGGAATEVVLTHRDLPPSRIESHRNGWTDILRKAGEALD